MRPLESILPETRLGLETWKSLGGGEAQQQQTMQGKNITFPRNIRGLRP